MSDANKGIPLKPLLLNFVKKHGFTEEDLTVMWAKKSIRRFHPSGVVSSPLDRAVCASIRELTKDEADGYRIRIPAVKFRLSSGTAEWLVYVDALKVNNEPSFMLRMVTVESQQKQSIL